MMRGPTIRRKGANHKLPKLQAFLTRLPGAVVFGCFAVKDYLLTRLAYKYTVGLSCISHGVFFLRSCLFSSRTPFCSVLAGCLHAEFDPVADWNDLNNSVIVSNVM